VLSLSARWKRLPKAWKWSPNDLRGNDETDDRSSLSIMVRSYSVLMLVLEIFEESRGGEEEGACDDRPDSVSGSRAPLPGHSRLYTRAKGGADQARAMATVRRHPTRQSKQARMPDHRIEWEVDA
jgi:hypothetical protein